MRYLAFLCLLFAVSASAEADELFSTHDVLDLSIRGPFEELLKSKDEDEREFVLSIGDSELDLKLRRRGKSRQRVCDFPPLRVNFARKQTSGTPFAGENKLKLVTHCMDADRYEQNTVEEYLAYRLFNKITATSYRVRLARVRYLDSDGEQRAHRFGFFVESSSALAGRLEAEISARRDVTRSAIDEPHATLMYVFQFLIGNTDWSLARNDLDETCCHNVDLFERDGKSFAVPYDFDLSGLVDAAYAKPDPSIRIRSVKIRRYRGYCASPEFLGAALRSIADSRAELLGTVQEIPGLQTRSAEKATKYLGDFFDAIEPQDKTLNKFERRCL